jgi:hypothetical protein
LRSRRSRNRDDFEDLRIVPTHDAPVLERHRPAQGVSARGPAAERCFERIRKK